jgi:hypothetical protein
MIFKDQIDAKSFTEKVEQLVMNKGLDYFSAIFHLAELHNISEERIPQLITGQLKDKLRAFGENRNMLKKHGKLPI